jgi:hypothetical protein
MAACKLCSLDPRTVEAAFASGANDRAIARQFNISAMSVGTATSPAGRAGPPAQQGSRGTRAAP